jgi:hypothetical protein
VVIVVETTPPADPTEPDGGEISIVGAAAWVTPNATDTPPIVTTTLPDLASPVFAATVTVNATPLVPEFLFNDTHEGEDDTDHDDWFVNTVVLRDPPGAPTEPDFESKFIQGVAPRLILTRAVFVSGESDSTSMTTVLACERYTIPAVMGAFP